MRDCESNNNPKNLLATLNVDTLLQSNRKRIYY